MKDEREKSGISRRNFVIGGALTGVGAIIAACVKEETIEFLDPTKTPSKTATQRLVPEIQPSLTAQPTTSVEPEPERTSIAAEPSAIYRVNEGGEVQELVDGEWRNVPLPEGTEPSQADIVMRESVPEFRAEGLGGEIQTIGEYRNGEWRIVPSDISLDNEDIINHTQWTYVNSRLKDYSNYDEEVLFESHLLGSAVTGVRFDIEPDSGETRVILLVSWDKKLFQVSPTRIFLYDRQARAGRRIISSNLSVEECQFIRERALEVLRQPSRLFQVQPIFMVPSSEATDLACDDIEDTFVREHCESTPQELRPASFQVFEAILKEKMIIPTLEMLSADEYWWENASILSVPSEIASVVNIIYNQ